MARARNIKPGFFSNDALAELPALTRLLFAGLWTIADRSGRLEDRPKKIKAEVLPYDAANIDKMLGDLQSAGFLVRYEAEGKRYLQVTKFEKHQNPHKNEAESTIPAPEQHSTSTVQEPTKAGTTPADSLLLIPDSNSLSTDSGVRADGANPAAAKRRSEIRSQAAEILTFLNAKAGRNFDLNGANADHVVARLKEGESVDDCRAVIALKCREWSGDEKMSKFLRPETLFNRTKFATYKGELTPPEAQ